MTTWLASELNKDRYPQAEVGHPQAPLEMGQDGERVTSRTHLEGSWHVVGVCGVGGEMAGEMPQVPIRVVTLTKLLSQQLGLVT